MRDKIIEAMKDAEEKALDALAGYKFIMFGYHASRWVNYKQLLGEQTPSPFTDLVRLAQEMSVH